MLVAKGFLVLAILVASSNAITIDVRAKYGAINYETVKSAIRDAQAIFARSANSVVTVQLSAGYHYLNPPSHKQQAVLFSGKQPGPGGRLIFRGVSKSSTIIVVPKGFSILRGRDVYRLTVRDLTLMRNQPMVSQGTVVKTGVGFVILKLPKYFPDVRNIIDKEWGQGRFLRRYRQANGRCYIIPYHNEQIPYSGVESLGKDKDGRQEFKFILAGPYNERKPNYPDGSLVGVKSKCCNQYGRDTFWFCRGDDIVFENLKFVRSSRGTFRCGISNVRISNVLIHKENQNWCLATSGGGPQIGQPFDPPIKNIIVENLTAEGTGDDAIGLFNVKSGFVRDCKIRDSFARAILLYKSSSVQLERNVYVRNNVGYCEGYPCNHVA